MNTRGTPSRTPSRTPSQTHSRAHDRTLGRTRFALAAAAFSALAALASPAFAKGGGDPAVPGEILLRLRSAADYPALANRYGLVLKAQFGARPMYRIGVAGNANVDAVVAALELDLAVIQAERNALHSSPEARSSSVYAIGTQTQYVTQWAPQALRLDRAHTLSTGAGVRVAVLDTGIDAKHPVFAGKLIPGRDFVDGDNDPSEVGSMTTHPTFGHGTHAAGVIALMAPGARIMPLRVLDADGSTNAWTIAQAMLHAVDPDGNPATADGAHVINLSLGSINRTEILDAITRLGACSIPTVPTEPANDFTDPGFNADKERCRGSIGAVVIAAAGNDASKDIRQFPAAEGAYGLLPVTASNSATQLASFANHGSWIDVAAPGDGITSAMPGGQYATWGGTSMAAAVTSGVAALVVSRMPTMAARDVARRLERASGSLCGDTNIPRLDAAAALENTTAPAPSCR